MRETPGKILVDATAGLTLEEAKTVACHHEERYGNSHRLKIKGWGAQEVAKLLEKSAELQAFINQAKIEENWPLN